MTSTTAPSADTIAVSIQDVYHSYSRRSALSLGGTSQTSVLKGISLDIPAGKTFGLVGESGCGKTTLMKAILRLIEPSSGEILLRSGDGEMQNVLALDKASLKQVRRRLQVVFQDPYGSLNPRKSVFQIVGEPLLTHLGMSKNAAKERVGDLLELVGLDPRVADRYPHEFSGGQRQRIGIARALAFEPTVLILDEPVSALDVSVQAQILSLLIDLQKKLHLTYLFVSHDLAVVEHMADLVAVMYLGKIVELGDPVTIFREASHPYTQALLSASPIPDVHAERQRRRILLRGDVSSASGQATGCQFAPRCPLAEGQARCTAEPPELTQLAEFRAGHRVACHFPHGINP